MGAEPEPVFVGWREWVALPGLGVPGVKAKIDTGARTSALHATHMERYQGPGGEERVRFCVHPLQEPPSRKRGHGPVLSCTAPVVDARRVTPSSGHSEHRLVIRTPLRLGALEWEVEITLTDRADMRFRMLLGRSALTAQRLLVDPARSYLAGPRLRSVYRARS